MEISLLMLQNISELYLAAPYDDDEHCKIFGTSLG